MVQSLVVGGAFVEQVCLTQWTATHEAAKVAQGPSRHQRTSAAFPTHPFLTLLFFPPTSGGVRRHSDASPPTRR